MTRVQRFVTAPLARVMGCRGALSVAAPAEDTADLIKRGVDLLAHLERCWSRFLRDSDVTRINLSDGAAPVPVDPVTIELLREMAIGVRLTRGAFDPTVLRTIAGLGYVPAWDGGRAGPQCFHGSPDPWVDQTMVDSATSSVVVPAGVQLDPGAIGKGLAGDMVANQLVTKGAEAVRVVVGGDVRVTSPTVIGVASPFHRGTMIDYIRVPCGGVATSGIARSWAAPDGARVHHAIDPSTARPLPRALPDHIVQVTVAAGSAALAEVLATATLVDPSERRLTELDQLGAGVLAVNAAGEVIANGAWQTLRDDLPDTLVMAS